MYIEVLIARHYGKFIATNAYTHIYLYMYRTSKSRGTVGNLLQLMSTRYKMIDYFKIGLFEYYREEISINKQA